MTFLAQLLHYFRPRRYANVEPWPLHVASICQSPHSWPKIVCEELAGQIPTSYTLGLRGYAGRSRIRAHLRLATSPLPYVDEPPRPRLSTSEMPMAQASGRDCFEQPHCRLVPGSLALYGQALASRTSPVAASTAQQSSHARRGHALLNIDIAQRPLLLPSVAHCVLDSSIMPPFQVLVQRILAAG